MTQAYPLKWPAGWPRTAQPKPARFGQKNSDGWLKSVTIAVARERLQREIDLLGGRDAVLSTNVELRLDGMPRSALPGPKDPGVAFYFRLGDRPIALACDKWERVADNITAIAKHIEAMRGMDRWGVGNKAQAFAGYEALPAPEQWWQVLGVAEAASLDAIDAAWRALARTNHPDQGGSHAAMARINAARDAGVAARGVI